MNAEANLDTQSVTMKGSEGKRGGNLGASFRFGIDSFGICKVSTSLNLSLLWAFFSLGTERLCDERSHKAQYKFLLLLDGAVAATALFCMEVFRHNYIP